MDNTKKLLEKLVKIAESQQKMINKLAQALPPPQDLEPAPTQKSPQEVLMAALPANLKAIVVRLFTRAGDMYVKFSEGNATQANYNAVLNVMQKLTREGKIQQAFALKLLP